ncbi:MAG: transglycosylase SLT domain-containing protein, partial [Campylobacterota bacterium]|nr:transglycosylase SLT domain-containing protein [Campylobacterota bacterium]
MLKVVFITAMLSMPSLFAALTYESDDHQALEIVQALDIDSTFLNDTVLNEMLEKNFSRAHNRHFFNSMMDAYLFIPAIKNTLAQANIPAEFLYLAMAESNFHLKAYSPKRAAGLWQFMPKTGKLLGL